MANPVFALLEPYGPSLPATELVEEVNRIFHEFEAEYYDRRHPEITELWPPLWREMMSHLGAVPAGGWRVLDFGCGTGFASEQVLGNLDSQRIAALTCFDLSPAMVDQCRRKISPRDSERVAVFTDRWEKLHSTAPHNLLATNSLWHHLPDPLGTLRELSPLLSQSAVWLCGHEPSCRFYKNPDCAHRLQEYKEQTNRRRRPWFARLRQAASRESVRRIIFRTPSPKKLTAKEAARRGLFREQPPAQLIDRLVDLHVAHTPQEAEAGRGFDFREMQSELRGSWDLVWIKTYSYMGPLLEGELPQSWQAVCKKLAALYPDDGAAFCSVWRRTKQSAR